MDGATATITVDKTAAYNGSLKDVSGASSIETTYTTPMADGKVKTDTFYTYTKNDNGSYSLTACQYQDDKNAGSSPRRGKTLPRRQQRRRVC